MTVRTPTFVQALAHPAEDVRLALRSLAGYFGVDFAADLEVTENGTPDLSVNVAEGGAWIYGTESLTQGLYHAYNDSTENLPLAAADPSDPRIDLVVLAVEDSAYSGSADGAALAVVTGTPAATPTTPAPPDNALPLAVVEVAAGATSVTNSNIVDLRFVRRHYEAPWGYVTEATPANFTFTTSTGSSPTFTWREFPGRRYRVTVTAEYQNGTAVGTVASLTVATSADVTVSGGTVLRWTARNAADQHRASGVFTYDSAGDNVNTWKVRASSSLSSATQTIVSPVVLIEDIGPAV